MPSTIPGPAGSAYNAPNWGGPGCAAWPWMSQFASLRVYAPSATSMVAMFRSNTASLTAITNGFQPWRPSSSSYGLTSFSHTLAWAPTQPLGGRWIVLIDDVVTTGSTLAACAAPLLAAGAIGVSAITVARER